MSKVCSVEGCQLPVLHNEYCSPHYHRNRRHGDPLGGRPRKDLPVHKYRCRIEACDRTRYALELCCSHYNRQRKYGDPLAGGMYHGDLTTISYAGVHTNLRRVRGPASKHKCIKCGKPASAWSYRGGSQYEQYGPNYHGWWCAWSGELEYYDPMCTKCHVSTDKSAAAEDLRWARTLLLESGLTKDEIREKLGLGLS